MSNSNIKLYGKELKSEEIIKFMKENYTKIKEYKIEEENKHIFIWNPQNFKPKPRPIKEKQKIIELTEEESRSMLIKKRNKIMIEVDKSKKVNLCVFIKADGLECKAKLKHGNCYCVRHMKMVERRNKTQENLKKGS